MFKQAFRHQRCLIPATGYFEWDQQTKPPYYFYSKNRSIMAFAGLWSHWMDQATGEVIDSCTILTGGAPESWAGIHPRMPVIMPPSTYTPWLDPQTDQTTLMRCLQQATDLTLQTHPITKKVGNPRFKSAQCLEPDA
jgi:putative SOS response-associated peptidase YedK